MAEVKVRGQEKSEHRIHSLEPDVLLGNLHCTPRLVKTESVCGED
jgi:hypothetical protein